jgi:hypothetical protein
MEPECAIASVRSVVSRAVIPLSRIAMANAEV